MKNKLLNLMLFSGSILITLLIAEVLLAFFYPQPRGPVRALWHEELGVINVPDQKGRVSKPGIFDYSFEHNHRGFRITSDKNNRFARKILFLGDSFTYGVGVDDEETFAYLLQEKLFQDSIEIFNGGYGGKGTDYALKLLQTIGKELKPQTVIYMVFTNDFSDNLRGEYFDFKEGQLIPKVLQPRDPLLSDTRIYSWLGEHSHLFSLLRQFIINLHTGPDDQLDYFYHQKELQAQSIEITEIYLKELYRICKKEGMQLIINYIPNEMDFTSHADVARKALFRPFLDTFTAEHHIPFHDFTTEITDSEQPYQYFYFEEGHWNEKGHQLAARRLMSQLDQVDGGN